MMTCERCGKQTEGYGLWDYCLFCSRNLCPSCMEAGRCPEGSEQRHAACEPEDE